MKMKEIQTIAKQKNIKPGRLKKQQLVRAIQEKENNYQCFQTAVESCDQYDCCWRGDCQPVSKR